MNLQDQVIYRCIHAACARPLPRKVNFCPYCGTGQHDGVVNHAHMAPPAQTEPLPSPPAAAPVAAAVAQMVAVEAAAAPTTPAPAIAKAVPAAPRPAAQVGVAAPPPRRQPVRLRHWLIVLAGLWLIWLYARPSTRNIDDTIAAIASAGEECRLNDAQSALIKLRLTKAKPEQVNSAQKTVDSAVASCGRKQAREKAWTETQDTVEAALGEGEFAKAQARLSQFIKRYNEDGATRKLKEKIAARRSAAAPAPLPYERVEPSVGQKLQSVRNLIDEADRALASGNYRAAADKLETCMTMVDPGNRECAAFKVHAERMQADKQRCLAGGREWYEDRCH